MQSDGFCGLPELDEPLHGSLGLNAAVLLECAADRVNLLNAAVHNGNLNHATKSPGLTCPRIVDDI